MKTIRLFLYFVIGFLFASWGVLANAETVPATSEIAQKITRYTWYTGSGEKPYFDTKPEVCDAWRVVAFPPNDPFQKTFIGYNAATQSCDYKIYVYGGWTYSSEAIRSDTQCPSGFTDVGTQCQKVSCPANQGWTLSGQTCTRSDCVSPEVRNLETGICEVPKDCTPIAGKSQPGITGLNFSGNGSMPSELCFDGCAYSTDFAVGLTGPGGSAMWGARAGKPTGNLCSPGSGEPTLDCPSGEVPTADGKGCESNCFQCVETPAGKCVKSTVCSARSGTFSQISQTCGPSCADQQKEGDKECGPDGVLIGRSHGQPVCLKSAPKDESCTSRGGTVVGTVDGKPICNLPDSPATCPDGTPSQGTVNGTPVCRGVCPPGMLLTDSADGGQSCKTVSPVTDKKTDMKPDAKPEGTKVNGVPVGDKSKSTVCQGDNCTTTEVERDGNGNIIGTKEMTGAKSDFCEKNPTSPLCSGQTEGDKFCKDNPDSIQCMKAGEVGEEGALTESSRGVQSITATPLTTNATCPAPIALPVGEISWTPICNAAEWLKPLILAFAWLSAGLIVIGGIKTEG